MSSLLTEESKLPYHPERLLEWRRGVVINPVTIDMALTRKCNMKCVYCYSQLQENPGKIEHKHFSAFLEDASQLAVKGISLVSDGESTCVPWCPEALEEGLDTGFDMAIGTNGVLFTKEKYGHLMGRLTYVRFNISAGTEDGYKMVHGTTGKNYKHVVRNILDAVEGAGDTTIGMQMVLLPEYSSEVIPLCRLAIKCGVDYLVIKHCSDDEKGSLGVDYKAIQKCAPLFDEAEAMSTDQTLIFVKRQKIAEGNQRTYSKCHGPPFIPQISGSGLIAPCGMFFHPKYKKYHLGYIQDGFKKVWRDPHTWEIFRHLASGKFDARKECGSLCLQHATNKWMDDFVSGRTVYKFPKEPHPHQNFI